MKNLNKPELLSPAGNTESFMSAINNGADAIYLGLDDFNARGNIENFTRDNLKEVVSYAHLFGVKIYLTLNTLIKDEEIEKVIELVRFSISCKVDAFIVQDIGLAYLLFNKFEGIELHASTQMGIENLEGASLLEELGFTRVVLARETPLDEIKRIKDNTNLEIEYFVQGALCVGYSGNCYLCSLLKGASGNRGKCKQLCRLPYRIDNKNEGYYLSTKDFCMLPMLKDFFKSGVTSFKIEGRARRPAYVAVATKCYRNAIDNNFNFKDEDIIKLKKVFNRGDFITGYFREDKKLYSSAQNHIGVEIGKVLDFNKGKRFNEVIISSNHVLKIGDTIKIFDKEREVSTLSPVDIKQVDKNKFLFTTTSNVKRGQIVRLIVDNAMETQYLSNKRKIEIEATFIAKINEKAKLIFKFHENIVQVESEFPLTEAKSQPLSFYDCKTSFSKLGDEFELKNIECVLENVFMRKSDLNELRRKAILKLKESIIRSNEKQIIISEKEFKLNSTEKPPKNVKKIVFFDNLDKLSDIKGDYLVYSPKVYNKEEIIKFAKKYDFYLDMPVIVTGQDMRLIKDIILQSPNLGVYATNYYALGLTTPDKTIIGSELNVYNSYSIEFYIKRGYKKIVLSKEDVEESSLCADNVELFIEDKPPRLIYFKHCPIKEHFNGNCSDCKYKDNIKYSLGKDNFILERKKLISCHFYLKGEQTEKKESRFGRVIEKNAII